MSVASEIARITQNIADSLDAVATKGVTVPSGSTSDDLAGLILQITGGGGTGAFSHVVEQLTGGGEHHIITGVDISDTTATAADVASGKYFYTANGTKTLGTGSGGGGGLEYESGTWTPSEDIAIPTISFTNTHTTTPIYYMFADATGTYDTTTNTNHLCVFYDYYGCFGSGIMVDSSTQRYAQSCAMYRGNSSTSFSSTTSNVTNPPSDPSTSTSAYYGYWVTNSSIKPSSNSSTRYWRAGRTYKWIAVWNSPGESGGADGDNMAFGEFIDNSVESARAGLTRL